MTGYWLTIAQDVRLSAQHISLLVALLANQQASGEPFSVYRPALMKQSRISRKETYLRCLQDLHTYQYIRYEPGHRYDPTKITFIVPPNVTDEQSMYPPNVTHAAAIVPPNRTDTQTMYPPNGTDEISIYPPNVTDEKQKEADKQGSTGMYPPNVTDETPGQPPSSASKKKSITVKNDVDEDAAADRRARSVVSTKPARRSDSSQTGTPATSDIPFSRSEFYDLNRFVTAFAADPKFVGVDLDHYHEALKDWRDKRTGMPPVRTDWLATARTFIRNDRAAGRLVTCNPTVISDGILQPLGHPSTGPGAVIDRSRYRRDRPGKLGI